MFGLSTRIIQQAIRPSTTRILTRQISRYTPLLSDHNNSKNKETTISEALDVILEEFEKGAKQVKTDQQSSFTSHCDTTKTTKLKDFAADCDTTKTAKFNAFAEDCDITKTAKLKTFAADCDTTNTTKLKIFATNCDTTKTAKLNAFAADCDTTNTEKLKAFTANCDTAKTAKLNAFAADCDTTKTAKLNAFAAHCDTTNTEKLKAFTANCDTEKTAKLNIFATELQQNCNTLVDAAVGKPINTLRSELTPRIKNTEDHVNQLDKILKDIGIALVTIFALYAAYYVYRYLIGETQSMFDLFAPKAVERRVKELEDLARIDILERRIHNNWASSYWTWPFSSQKDVDQYNEDIAEKKNLENKPNALRIR